jgi:hypothetical protein
MLWFECIFNCGGDGLVIVCSIITLGCWGIDYLIRVLPNMKQKYKLMQLEVRLVITELNDLLITWIVSTASVHIDTVSAVMFK